MTSTSTLLVSRDNGVRTITFNVPVRLNSVDARMLNQAADAVVEARQQDRVIVFRGAGRAFCAGADLGKTDDLAGENAAATIDGANRLVEEIVNGPLPVVSVIHGPCAGVGVSIAAAADLVLASTASYFQLAFTRVGLMPDGGATALIAAAAGRGVAMRMALLAERLHGAEARASGLVTHLAESDELEDTVTAVLKALRSGPARAYAETRRAVNAAALNTLSDAFGRERRGQLGLLAAPDFTEGAQAFGEKREPVFTDRPIA